MPKTLKATLHIVLVCALVPFIQAQTLSKEYIRLGGRVIAVESATGGSGGALTVQPSGPILGAGSVPTIQFAVTSPNPPPPLSWSISGMGSIGPTTGVYQVPVCIASQQSIQVTATSTGYQSGNATITLTVPSSLSLPAMTFSSSVTQCVAVTSITTANSTVIINGTANVTFKASAVYLEPGFQASSSGGATFNAKTQ